MIESVLKKIIAGIYALLVIAGTMQVLSRYAFGTSLAWSEEFIRYAFFWSVMLTAGLVAGTGEHLRVDYVSDRLSAPWRRALMLFNDLLFFVFASAILWLGAQLAWRATAGGSRSPAMDISMGWIYLAFPVGGLLLVGFHIKHCWLRDREPK